MESCTESPHITHCDPTCTVTARLSFERGCTYSRTIADAGVVLSFERVGLAEGVDSAEGIVDVG